MISKEAIQALLASDDRAVARAILVLNDRQTADEQAQEGTRYLNGMGFRPCHARMGTSMAKFFKRTGYLTPKQIAYWRVKDRTGSTRIEIYWKQLQEAAEAKKNATPVKSLPGLTGSPYRDGHPTKSDIMTDVAREKGLPVTDVKLHDYGPRGTTTAPQAEVIGQMAVGRDYGNDMELRMILAEQLGEVLDSDDPKMIDPIADQIDEIDAFWAKIRAQG